MLCLGRYPLVNTRECRQRLDPGWCSVTIAIERALRSQCGGGVTHRSHQLLLQANCMMTAERDLR